MGIVKLTGTLLADAPGRPLLVVGPSLGTSVEALWGRCVERLEGRFHVIGWDLPGHGRSPAPIRPVGPGSDTGTAPGSPGFSGPSAGPGADSAAGFSVGDLARAVLDLVGDVPFRYAGVSAGGVVGLQLMLDAPEQVQAAVLLCTGAKIGTPEGWHERAALVRASSTSVMIEGSAQRWFAPGFLDREPDAASALLHALRDADAEGYSQVCEMLAGHDLRGRLAEITAPVLAVAGAHDGVTTPAVLAEIAEGVRYGRLEVLDDTAHLAPAEHPDVVAGLLIDHLDRPGTAVRRTVLGDAHVDRANAAMTPFTAPFHDLITRYAWGEIWSRPGLDRRSRSMITLTALVALGHHDELALHIRAARRNGLTNDEITEVLLQSAIYCGVPAANTAFRVAQRVLDEMEAENQAPEEAEAEHGEPHQPEATHHVPNAQKATQQLPTEVEATGHAESKPEAASPAIGQPEAARREPGPAEATRREPEPAEATRREPEPAEATRRETGQTKAGKRVVGRTEAARRVAGDTEES